MKNSPRLFRSCRLICSVPRLLRLAVCALWLVGLAGCSKPTCEITGKFTYKNKPIVCGTATFVGPDGMSQTADLDTDGKYTVKGLPPGHIMVGILSQDPARPLDPRKGSNAGPADEPIEDTGRKPIAETQVKIDLKDKSNWAEPNVDRSKWIPLPRKYVFAHTSGLSVDTHAGANEKDFNLE